MASPRRGRTSRDDTMEWFQQARFGLFIHWGVYSLLGKGEWIQNVDHISVEEYEKLPPRFNPVKFDPDQWAQLAKEAGMKYMVITTKHHDGFCMWDTALTDYNIMNTPYGKDIIALVTRAFRRRGLRVGYYHSIMDWHHPDYLPRRPWEERSAEGADLKRYVRYMRGQLRELFSRYGNVFCLWYDGGWEHTAEELDSARTNRMVRRLQPGVLINNRAQIPEDFQTPEQRIPPTGLTDDEGRPVAWEACITMTSHWWGYDKHERDFKSPEFLVRMLIDIVSKGGNLLLNIGPKPDGTIQREFVSRLRAIGKWMARYGEAIYGTTASPFNLLPFHGRVTVKGKRLYVHVFDWPVDRRLRLPGLRNQIRRAFLVERGRPKLAASQDGDDWIIDLPARAPNAIASVIGVDLDEAPCVEPYVIRPDDDGIVELPALFAALEGPHGQRIRYGTEDGVVHVENWIRTQDTVSWTFELPKRGRYELSLDMAVDPGQGGSKCLVIGNGKETTFKTSSTGSTFRTRKVAALALRKGENTLVLRPESIRRESVMRLRGAQIRPIT